MGLLEVGGSTLLSSVFSALAADRPDVAEESLVVGSRSLFLNGFACGIIRKTRNRNRNRGCMNAGQSVIVTFLQAVQSEVCSVAG